MNSLYNKLERTSHTDFYTIEEYLGEIPQIHKEITYTTGQFEPEAISRANESFYTNIHYATKLEMEKEGITDAQLNFKCIRRIEKLFLGQLNNIRNNMRTHIVTPKTQDNNHKNDKYCTTIARKHTRLKSVRPSINKNTGIQLSIAREILIKHKKSIT